MKFRMRKMTNLIVVSLRLSIISANFTIFRIYLVINQLFEFFVYIITVSLDFCQRVLKIFEIANYFVIS